MEVKTGFERRYDVEGPESIDTAVLQALPFEYPGQEIRVVVSHPEFTSVCPWTGLPDFAEIRIEYVPDRQLVELKSLKYYLLSYRNVGILQEHAVARILNDLARFLQPRYMKVTGVFNARGGLGTTVEAEYRAPGA